MKAKLFCRHGAMKGREFEFDGEATIGRSRDNTVQIEPSAVSSRHARIYFEEDQDCYFLEDLDSLNGTELDSVPVMAPERLGHLHVITFAGSLDFVFQDLHLGALRHQGSWVPETTLAEQEPPALPAGLDARPPSHAEADAPSETTQHDDVAPELPAALVGPTTDVPEAAWGATVEAESGPVSRAPQPEVGAEGEKAAAAEGQVLYLEVLHFSGSQQRFRLREGENVVGRSKKSHIRIQREQISRRHAVLTLTAGKVAIRDEGSRNHTWVGETRLDRESTVDETLKIRFGDVEARLVHGAEDMVDKAGQRH